MTSNKLFISGLALTGEVRPEEKFVHNYDFHWLLYNPSALLWADEIIIPSTIYNVIQQATYPGDEDAPFAFLIRQIVDVAGESDLVKIVKCKDIFTQIFFDNIQKSLEQDRKMILSRHPDTTNTCADVPLGFSINKQSYCGPQIFCLYLGLEMAKILQANVFLNTTDIEYLRLLTVADHKHQLKHITAFRAFSSALNIRIPEPEVHIRIGNKDNNCYNCKSSTSCSKSDFKRNLAILKTYIKFRDYDEVAQLRNEINNLRHLFSGNGLEQQDYTEFMQRFKERESILQGRINRIFPKIRRWSYLATIISIPFGVTGQALGEKLLTIPAAATFGFSEIGRRIIEYFESKYKWVGFRQSNWKEMIT